MAGVEAEAAAGTEAGVGLGPVGIVFFPMNGGNDAHAARCRTFACFGTLPGPTYESTINYA